MSGNFPTVDFTSISLKMDNSNAQVDTGAAAVPGLRAKNEVNPSDVATDPIALPPSSTMASTAVIGLEALDPVPEPSIAAHYSPLSSSSSTEGEALPRRAILSKSAELT